MAGRPVDEKIVVMKLDNSDFKQKAAETTTIFGKIRDALSKLGNINLGKTTQEIGAIGEKANGIKLDRIGNEVESISRRFSAWGVVAATVISNITNRILDASLTMANSFTFQPLTDGFNEYETKIGAIGTMLANTEWAGSTLDDVKKTLGVLNDYADNTIYSFEQMTQNVGRFTAAGVTLEDSATAIKGLGNLAAASGSDVNQLNTAMYQSSQALASGKLNLEDWNSLVNAGMAGKKTQDALVATAKAMGKNVDLSNGFRNSIADGWLTSEVFLATLKKFGEDESMTKAATSVRTFTGMMGALKESVGSGWAQTWEIVFGDFDQATAFWTNMSNAIGGWFKHGADARNMLLNDIDTLGGVQNMFSGFGNIAKVLGQVFQSVGDGFRRVFPPKSAAEIVALTQRFKDFTAGLKLSTGPAANLTTIFQGIFSVFSSAIEITKRVARAFLQIIPPGSGAGVLDFLAKIARVAIEFNKSLKAGNGLTKTIDGLGVVFNALGRGISASLQLVGTLGSFLISSLGKVVSWIHSKLAPIGQFIKDTFSNIGMDDAVGTGFLVGLFLVVKKIMDFFGNAGDIVDSVKEVFEGISDSINNFAAGVKIANLMLIAIAIGILAASLKTLESVKTDDITKGITALALSLGVMIAGMMIMDKFKVTGGIKASLTIIALATAVSILAGALKRLSDLNPEQLRQGMQGLIITVGTLSVALIALSKWGGKVKVGSLQLIALATSIYILASAVKTMSNIKAGDLFKSIEALSIIFAELTLFLKVVNKTKLSVGTALAIVAIAGAINLMVFAIKGLASVDIVGLAKGLTSIAIILGEIVLFSRLVKGPTLLLAGAGIVLIAAAINMLLIPLKVLSGMSMTELGKGLGAIAIALLAVAGAAKLMNGSLMGAIAITIMAVALNALYIPIRNFANMSWGELIKGFVGLGGGLLLIAGAALLLSPAVVPMLGFAAALLAMSVAVLAVGAGIGLFALGLASLATLTATSVAAIVAALGMLLQGLASLIPAAVNFIVQLGLALINGIVLLIPAVVNALVILIDSLLTALVNHLPEFIAMGTLIIVQLLDGLSAAIPTILDAAIRFIVDLINGMSQAIRDNGQQLVSAIMELLGEILILFIEAGAQVISALFGWIPGVEGAMKTVGTKGEQAVREAFKAKEAGEDKGIDFAGALSGTSGQASSAGSTVGQSAHGGVMGVDIGSIGGLKGGQFASGLGSMSGTAHSNGVNLANSGKSGASSVDMSSAGTNFGLGFANGISGSSGSVWSAAVSLAQRAKNAVASWLDMHSPSRLMMKDGGFFSEGFAIGIANKTNLAAKSAKNLAMTAKDSLNQFLDGFDVPDGDNELHFKAVIDYDSVDPSKFGSLKPVNVVPNTSVTTGNINATRAINRQNADINLTKTDDGVSRQLLSDIKDNIARIDPNKPVYLIVNDKVLGQSVTKNVIDNYDLKYMKAERGLADA